MIQEIKINNIYPDRSQDYGLVTINPVNTQTKVKVKANNTKRRISIKLKPGSNYSKEAYYAKSREIKRRLGGGSINISKMNKKQLREFVLKYQI